MAVICLCAWMEGSFIVQLITPYLKVFRLGMRN